MWITFTPVGKVLANALKADFHRWRGVGKQGVFKAVQFSVFFFHQKILHAEEVAAAGAGFFKDGRDFSRQFLFRGGKHSYGNVAAVRRLFHGQGFGII